MQALSKQSKSLIANHVSSLDKIVDMRLKSQVPLVDEVVRYILNSGGKRLRPILLLVSAGSVGFHGDRALELAVALEFIHTATLLHDDVVDESNARRGIQTANIQFGNATSVLVGDFLYSRAFQIMVDVGESRVFGVMADATNDISEGEVLQLSQIGNLALSEADYFRVVQSKTSRLFEAAAQLGGILGGAATHVENDLAVFGRHIGTAFQIIDDVLDYIGDEAVLGKNLGDDLSEGKITLPLIHALNNGSNEHVEVVSRAIQGGDNVSFSDVLVALNDLGSIDYSLEKAAEETRSAIQRLSHLKESPSKQCLIEMAQGSLSRVT